MYCVIKDYTAQRDGEIDLKIGHIIDEVTLTKVSSSSGQATVEGKTVTFPIDCVVKVAKLSLRKPGKQFLRLNYVHTNDFLITYFLMLKT